MNKKQKLQRLLKVFTPDNTLADFGAFDEQINQLKNNLKEKVTVKTLEQVNVELEKFKKRIDLQPILDSLREIESSFGEKTQSLYEELGIKLAELNKADETRAKVLKSDIDDLNLQISSLETSFKLDITKVKKSIPDLTDLEDRVSELTIDLETRLSLLENEEPQEIKDWQETIDKLRKDLMSRIGNLGGGNMNRKITFGSVDYLTKYTDINYIAGSNVTFTIANNNTTKMVNITISATGGGGGGTVRSINSISADTTAGSTSGTDYVYLVSGTTTLTLPDAVGNTNLYIIKNVGTGIVTIATTASETIDGTTTITMPVRYTAVDLISDTTNWNVT